MREFVCGICHRPVKEKVSSVSQSVFPVYPVQIGLALGDIPMFHPVCFRTIALGRMELFIVFFEYDSGMILFVMAP